ncbi:unnamed protein product [Heterobilharzia americana]|nr:unnamed protein product [Heterobilharzia americana]
MYIFLMDQGRLVSLDDNLLSQTVSSLRNVLAHDFDLPLNKQILLVSGGFQLEPGDKLSTYGAGLDKTNPIYVFTQTFPSDTNVQKPDVLQVNDGGYPRQLANLSELTPSEKVFEERLRLIHAITPISRETANAIEQLVSEQRQMIQGWCVALANLAEVAADTNKRLLFATSRLVQFEECITDWERKLHNFHELKKELSDLPLLPQLVVLDSSTEYNHQKESFNFNSIPKPTNMYEWVCLQSAMSSVGTRYFPPPSAIKSVGLQSGGLYHVRQGSGRIRTTSTGQLGGYSTTESTVVTTQPHQVHFYTGGSQSSLNNAGTGCSNSPTLDTRIQRDQSLAGVGGGGGGGGDSSSAHESTVFDYYESAFLEIIKRAIQDIHLLRFGPDSQICSTTKQQSDASSELNYVRAHTNRLSELITMVNACSKSNYDEMTAASTHPSTESSAMPGVQHLLVDSSKTVAAATERARTSSISSLLSLNLTREHDIHLISIRDALDPGYFSQRLSQLDPLACEAIDLARRIIGIEQAATKAFQQIVQQKLNSLLQTKFTENTVNSQELIIAFNRLCEILGIIMQSKLLLANNLSDRQRWLQNFQSELNRLDAIIQNCLRRMCRVTTTGTLISQLGEAGSTYARCLAEIVRRTEFEDMLTQRSVYYLKEENSLRAEECRRRRIFSKHLKNNVLHTLFSPWTNPKTDCIGLINLPTSITMSQDVTEQQLCEITSTVSTVSTTVTTQKVDSSSHCHPVTPELAVSRRFALSSLSEPRLNELAKVCALHRVNSRVRSNRLNSLSSPDPQLAKVKEGEMIESIRKKYTDSSYTSNQHQHHQTLPHHVVVNLRQHTQPVVDSNRRASIPLDQDRETTVSNWSVDSSSVGLTNHFCTSNTLFSIGKQPVKITREDLEKLMSSMPSSVCNLLRTELNKSFTLLKSSSCIGGGGYNNLLDQSSVTTGLKLTSTTTTTTTTTTISANTLITEKQIDRYATKSVNTSPLCSTINQPFSSSSSSSSLHLVSVACQTQFNLIGPVINVGSGRSLNSSLGLSVDDSTRRTAINNAGWEELPGSLCSWEICRFPIIRSRDRISISLNTLPRYEHLVTTATQTESSNELPETNLISNSSVPDNNDNNNPDTGAAEVDSTLQKVEKEVKYSGQNNSESPQEYDSEVYHFPFHSSLPHDDICQESKVLSTSPQSILSTEINDENVVLSSIFTEDDLFTDSTLMMTSSFHSTRTTFSNNIYDNTTTNNNNNNKADSSSQHTALMSVSQSRSVSLSRSSSSSSNLCDITGGVGSTTTQYGSVIYDDVKTSQNVMLLSSCSSSSPPPPLPRIEIPVSESTDQQNQTTTSLSSSTLLFDKCCSQCQLKYAHHKEYFNLLQQCLQLIDKRVNHHQQQQQGEEEEQAKNSDKLRIQKPITLSIETTPRSPLISLDSSQLKCLFNVLESCSSLFLKSKSTTR